MVGYEYTSDAVVVAPTAFAPPPVATIPAGQLAVACGLLPVAVAVRTIVVFATMTSQSVGFVFGVLFVFAVFEMYAVPW